MSEEKKLYWEEPKQPKDYVVEEEDVPSTLLEDLFIVITAALGFSLIMLLVLPITSLVSIFDLVRIVI